MSEKTYTVAEAAKALGMRVRTLQRLIKQGKIDAHRPNPFGKTSPYYIKQSEIDRVKRLQNK